jgi:hypothetical protein
MSGVRLAPFMIKLLAALLLVTALLWPSHSEAGAVQLLRVPGDGIQPQAVVDSDGSLHMIYKKGKRSQGDLFYVKRTKNIGPWSKAIRVNSRAGKAPRNSAIGSARLALDHKNRLHVTWLLIKPAKYYYTRMNSAKTAFEKQRWLSNKNLIGVESGAALVTDKKDNVYLFWHSGDFRTEKKRIVVMRRSTNGGQSFDRQRTISPPQSGVCAYCGLHAMVDKAGALVVSFRKMNGTDRGMTLLKSIDQGKVFQAQPIHKWCRSICPVSNTCMSQDADGTAHVTWETKGQIYWASVKRLEAPQRVPGLSPVRRKNPVILFNNKRDMLIVWAEGEGARSGGKLRWQIYDAKSAAKRRGSGKGKELPAMSMATAVALPNGQFVIIY